MDKSYVTLEQKCCVVCGRAFDTGALLMDTRLRPSFEHTTITGYDICPDDQAKLDAGFVALVECDPEKSGRAGVVGDKIKPGDAYRTGVVAFLKREAAAQLFNVPIPDKQPVFYVEPGVIEKIESQVKPEGSEDAQG